MDNLKSNFTKLKEKIFKKKKSSESAVDRMNDIMKLINTIAYIPGLEFEDNWKKSRRTAFGCLMLATTTSVAIYTLLVTFPAKENLILVGFFAFNALVWGKTIVVITKHDKFMSVVRYVLTVFKDNKSGPRERILFGVTKMIHYHLAINFSSFLAGYLIYSFFPLYDYIYNKKLTLISPLLIPYVNAQQLRGYFITTAFNVFLGNMCLTVCICVSSLFFALVDSYDGLVSLVEHDFGEFDDMCENNENSKACDAKMRNTLLELMDLARLSNSMNGMYNIIATVQIGMSAVVILGSLAAILAVGYINCIGATLAFYTEMLVYCYIGQLLDTTNIRITHVICNAKWYNYAVKYQKDMMFALYLSQNLKPILLFNVFPLNFATSLMITNKIYTAFMFMLEFFD
uniref:Odorant receptor n=1 Tax=Bradysia odoriphaga TaxID=1564500 RepID=A0A6B9C754_9DIPT|nr:odorant receptor 1 [Bradysia odoriphaga]